MGYGLIRVADKFHVHGTAQENSTSIYQEKGGKINLNVTRTISDNLLLAGDLLTITDFEQKLTKLFNGSKSIIDSAIIFNGFGKDPDRIGKITMNMKDYLSMIEPLECEECDNSNQIKRQLQPNTLPTDPYQEA